MIKKAQSQQDQTEKPLDEDWVLVQPDSKGKSQQQPQGQEKLWFYSRDDSSKNLHSIQIHTVQQSFIDCRLVAWILTNKTNLCKFLVIIETCYCCQMAIIKQSLCSLIHEF